MGMLGKTISGAVLAAVISLSSGCFERVSTQTYVGEVTKKEYYAWKCNSWEKERRGLLVHLNTDRGVVHVDFSCPEYLMENAKCEDVKDKVMPDYSSLETRANSEINVGDKIQINVTNWRSNVLYICPVVEYKKM